MSDDLLMPWPRFVCATLTSTAHSGTTSCTVLVSLKTVFCPGKNVNLNLSRGVNVLKLHLLRCAEGYVGPAEDLEREARPAIASPAMFPFRAGKRPAGVEMTEAQTEAATQPQYPPPAATQANTTPLPYPVAPPYAATNQSKTTNFGSSPGYPPYASAAQPGPSPDIAVQISGTPEKSSQQAPPQGYAGYPPPAAQQQQAHAPRTPPPGPVVHVPHASHSEATRHPSARRRVVVCPHTSHPLPFTATTAGPRAGQSDTRACMQRHHRHQWR